MKKSRPRPENRLVVDKMRFFCYNTQSWPYRLTVRTPGFHPGNPGSIPGKVTIKYFCNMSRAPSGVFIFGEVDLQNRE